VTNHHGGYTRITDSNGVDYLKRVLRSSPERDLCVIEGIDAPSLALAKSGPKRFDTVHVMGHPLLNPATPSSGQYIGQSIATFYDAPNEAGECTQGAYPVHVQTIFGEMTACERKEELGMTTVAIYPGNSGSPILNSDGDVIGVMSSARQDNRGMFIPLNYVREILAQ
jgi:S1-C subfamily serine protease